jgi:predicted ATPase
MPLVIPTKKDAIINEMKALSFTADIKTSNKIIPAIKINMDIDGI